LVERIHALKVVLASLAAILLHAWGGAQGLTLALASTVALAIVAMYEAARGLAPLSEPAIVALVFTALLARGLAPGPAQALAAVAVVLVLVVYAGDLIHAYPPAAAVGVLASLYMGLDAMYLAVQTPAEGTVAFSQARPLARAYALLILTLLSPGAVEALLSISGGLAALLAASKSARASSLAPTAYTILKILAFARAAAGG